MNDRPLRVLCVDDHPVLVEGLRARLKLEPKLEFIGELASALRHGTQAERAAEFADVLAWLATIANVVEVDLAEAIAEKYGRGCPGCGQYVCTCPDAGKP